jgi:Ni/Co efflux regulator RcnB
MMMTTTIVVSTAGTRATTGTNIVAAWSTSKGASYVDDYRHYDLAPPPHGHRWVRSPDGRYILIAVASGIIADILLHH